MEKAYNLNETAKLLGMKVSTLRSWVRENKLEATKIVGTNRWIVKESEIKRLRGEEQAYGHNN